MISRYIKNVFEEGKLTREATVAEFATVQREGDRAVTRQVEYYNLDVIISVGYRVKSRRGTQFRIWATQRLREYIVKGFTLDDERLKRAGGGNYFDELLARIRDIRSSEKVFWRKVLEIYATSIDYDPRVEASQRFFATVQNKMHWAVHGQTAAEVIWARADSTQPNMGLTSWTGERPRAPVARPRGPPAYPAAPHAETRPARPSRETQYQEGYVLPAAAEGADSLTSFIRHPSGATDCPEASRNRLLKKNFLTELVNSRAVKSRLSQRAIYGGRPKGGPPPVHRSPGRKRPGLLSSRPAFTRFCGPSITGARLVSPSQRARASCCRARSSALVLSVSAIRGESTEAGLQQPAFEAREP